MARKVESFPVGVKRGKRKYHWDKWTDGSAWELVHGKDFTCTPGSLVVYLYHKATELGMNVRTSIVRGEGKKPDCVVFQFRKREVVEAAQPASGQGKKLKR